MPRNHVYLLAGTVSIRCSLGAGDSCGLCRGGRTWPGSQGPSHCFRQWTAGQPESTVAAAALGIQHLPRNGDQQRPGSQPTHEHHDQAWWGCLHEMSLSSVMLVIDPVWGKRTKQSMQITGGVLKHLPPGHRKGCSTFRWSSGNFQTLSELLQRGGYKRCVYDELDKRTDIWP